MNMQTGEGFTIAEILAVLVIVCAALVVSCMAMPIF